MKQHHAPQAGFTLIEMVVVLSLFTIVVGATSDVFIRASRAQNQTAALQKLQDDVRFLTTTIAAQVRSGSINYGFYVPEGRPSTISKDGNDTLALANFEGSDVRLKRGSDEQAGACNDDDLKSPCVLLMSLDGGATWERASSLGVRIDALTFFISPDQNPFALVQGADGFLDYPSDLQPRVTVLLAARSTVKGLQETSRVRLQTTMSTREYRR